MRSYEVAEVTETDWALVYEIQGSNPSLKPLFLTAHQGMSSMIDPANVLIFTCRCRPRLALY